MNWEDVQPGDFVIASRITEEAMVRGAVKERVDHPEDGLCFRVGGWIAAADWKLLAHSRPAALIPSDFHAKRDSTVERLREKLHAFMLATPGEHRLADLAFFIKRSLAITSKHLMILLDQGKVRRGGYGKWIAVPIKEEARSA